MPLITAKPLIYACNVGAEDIVSGGNELSKQFMAHVESEYPGTPVVTLSVLLESEIVRARIEEGEAAAKDFMELYGLEESRLDELLEHCSDILNLQKFYTAGPACVSSWFVEKGATAPKAAGKIHGDFEKKFICAEVSKVDDWTKYKTEESLRSGGKMQKHGKDYVMQENDVIVVHHSAK